MRRGLYALFALCIWLLSACTEARTPVIGIAWREGLDGSSYVGTYNAIKAIGAEPVLLELVESGDLTYIDKKIAPAHIDSLGILIGAEADEVKRNTHKGSNVEEVMRGIDAVVFTGGEDISPTLFREPEPWHGIEAERDYNPTRDVSDYLLLSYCIDQDIPTLCICRAAQMLAIVSGAPLIQDIPTFYAQIGAEYDYTHRDAERRGYISHDAEITAPNSLLHKILGQAVITGTPSWHHQAIGSLEGTKAIVTASTVAGGVEIVEALERTDCRFVVGVQYHPEYVLTKKGTHDPNGTPYMSREEALRLFRALKDAIE